MPTCTCDTCTRVANEEVRTGPTCCECGVEFTRYDNGAGYYYCTNCVAYCTECESEGLPSDLTDGQCYSCNRPVCVVCGYRYDSDYGYGDTCSACYEESRTRYVHDYSYRPSPLWHRLPDEPNDHLYFGFELEVGTDDPSDVAETLYNGYGDSDNLLYCKSDSSVDGVEIVSHPMSHAYFSQAFPFAMFRNIRGIEEVQPTGHGLHIHVSRRGFKSSAHIMRWLLLIYRNGDEVARLARRTSDQWAGFSDGRRCGAKAKGSRNGDRYVAVNAQNAATLEVRVFRSTWREQELRAAMDFMHASVTYARGLSSHDVIRGSALSWQSFREWVAEREQYANLTRELSRLDGTKPENDEEDEW